MKVKYHNPIATILTNPTGDKKKMATRRKRKATPAQRAALAKGRAALARKRKGTSTTRRRKNPTTPTRRRKATTRRASTRKATTTRRRRRRNPVGGSFLGNVLATTGGFLGAKVCKNLGVKAGEMMFKDDLNQPDLAKANYVGLAAEAGFVAGVYFAGGKLIKDKETVKFATAGAALALVHDGVTNFAPESVKGYFSDLNDGVALLPEYEFTPMLPEYEPEIVFARSE